jgi:energy-coupling factor transporter transmembrane protein EcfT
VKFLILIGSFIVLTYTTTPEELSRGVEKLRIPYRICFAIALAFQQLGIMAAELRMIRDAQVKKQAPALAKMK